MSLPPADTDLRLVYRAVDPAVVALERLRMGVSLREIMYWDRETRERVAAAIRGGPEVGSAATQEARPLVANAGWDTGAGRHLPGVSAPGVSLPDPRAG